MDTSDPATVSPVDGGIVSSSSQLRALADITEQLNRIQLKRRGMEDARALDAEEMHLRRLWNSLLPANHLPSELLIRIFQLDAGDSEPLSRLQTHMAWVRLMLVCTYWRDVSCATPTLWSNLGITGNAFPWLDLCLHRSAMNTLRISLTAPSPEMIQNVATHSERIQAIAIYRSPISSSSSRLFSRPMPILHELVVTADAADAPGTINVEIDSTQFPVLRSLELHAVTRIPSDLNIYARLRRLTLSACGSYHPVGLLDVLRASTHLESLSISKMLRHFPQKLPRGSPPITLSHLSDFSLLDEFSGDICLFMAALRLPRTCSVTIRGGPDHFLEEWEEATMLDLLPANRAEALPMLSATSAVELVMDNRSFTLRGSELHGRGTISLSLVLISQSTWEIFLHAGLPEIGRVFGPAPVERLRVTGDHRYQGMHLGPWCSVFEALPMLRTIEISGLGAPSTMWNGLDKASKRLASRDPADGQASAACPGLRTVCIDGRSMRVSSSFFEALLDCLRNRVGCADRLDNLRMKLSPGQKEFEELGKRYLSQMQELVGNVSYELYD